MNKHENEKISLSQLIKQQSQMSISISATTYTALAAYCVKHNVLIDQYVDGIIMKSIQPSPAQNK
jgi:hypothetical protein